MASVVPPGRCARGQAGGAVPIRAAVPSPAAAPAVGIQAIANAYRDYTRSRWKTRSRLPKNSRPPARSTRPWRRRPNSRNRPVRLRRQLAKNPRTASRAVLAGVSAAELADPAAHSVRPVLKGLAGPEMTTTTKRARVHPAQPSRGRLGAGTSCKLDVAVKSQIGTPGSFRKGRNHNVFKRGLSRTRCGMDTGSRKETASTKKALIRHFPDDRPARTGRGGCRRLLRGGVLRPAPSPCRTAPSARRQTQSPERWRQQCRPKCPRTTENP